MALTKEQLLKLAEVTYLDIDNEVDSVLETINIALEDIDQIKKYENIEIKPLYNFWHNENVFFDDNEAITKNTEQYIEEAPNKKDNYFKVLPVIGGSDE